jgi:hypothetical protein
MKAADRTPHELADELQTRAIEHGSVATMLKALLIRCADDTADERRHPLPGRNAFWTDDLWEGLAVIAGYVKKDSSEMSDMVDYLRPHLPPKGGAR